MQQKPESQKSKCPKCKNGKEIPCRKLNGEIAAKVHYGRPFWSSLVGLNPDDAKYYIELWRKGEIKKAPKSKRANSAKVLAQLKKAGKI